MAFQIASDEATFIHSVRLLQVSHFDGAICKWGMPPRCRSGRMKLS
jgi:hypothetical protein